MGNALLRGLQETEARVAEKYTGQVKVGNIEAWQMGTLSWKKLSQAERHAVKTTVRKNLATLPFNKTMDAMSSLKRRISPEFVRQELTALREREVETALARGDVSRATRAFERVLQEMPEER